MTLSPEMQAAKNLGFDPEAVMRNRALERKKAEAVTARVTSAPKTPAYGPQALSAPIGKWPFQSLEIIKHLDLPPRECVIGPFNSASCNVVAAPRGTGKTMWMTEVAQGVASGEGFCDWECKQPGPVAFVQLDMPIQAVQKRAEGRGWHENFHYIARWHFQRNNLPTPDLGDQEHHAWIVAALKHYKMVIFDTRRAAQPPGQGAASNMWHPSYWLASAPVRHALVDAGVCVVFLDHLNSAGEVKDTKAIEDDADAVITLKDTDKGTEELCFHVEMSKDRDNVGEETYFQLGPKGWDQFTDGSMKEAVARYRESHTVKETAEKFGIGERTVKNYVREVKRLRREQEQESLRQWEAERTREATGRLTG